MPISRRSFALTSAGLLLRPANRLAEAAQAPGGAVFPFGTHVYREPHLPLEQLRADFPLIKRLGFTMVKIQESWSADEPHEGQIDLSTVEQVISAARQNGLLVYFGVTMEQAPAWLWKKYPDASMVYETGEPHNDPTQYLMPADGKPGPCWNHPGAREAGTRFVEAVGRTIGKYENIRVWNVWQEIGFWPMRSGHTGVCYCPYTLAAFRAWLRARYQTLPALNKAWRTAFGEWEDVAPPRMYREVPSWLDWRYFMDDVYLSEALRWKAEAFRRSDPGHRPVMAHMGAPTIGSTAEWRYASVVDIFGSSAYPSWGEMGDPDVTAEERVRKSPAVYDQLLDGVLMKFDYIRSATRTGDFWTAELEGGRAPGGVAPGRVPDAGDIRRWTLGCLAAGARGICYWNHRTEPFWGEGHGFGLLQMRGDRTERAAEASRIAEAVAAHPDLFVKGEVPRASIGVLLDERLWQFITGSGHEATERYTTTLRGIYRALWEEGYAADFLDSGQTPRDNAQYKALIFPWPVAIGPRLIEVLREYVSHGGTLISEACPGRWGDDSFAVAREMPLAIEELFGAKHDQLFVLDADSKPRILDGTGEFTGHHIAAAAYLQYLVANIGEPILRYRDNVAGSANRFGRGQAYLIGTLIGRGTLKGDVQNQRFLAKMLCGSGAAPDKIGGLQRRIRTFGPKSAWFLFNTTRQTIDASLPVAGFRSAVDLLGDPLPVSNGSAAVRVGPMDVRCMVLERA